MRTSSRRMLGLLLAACLIPGAAIAAPGNQIGVHPHATSHGYDDPFHRIRGRVGIVNGSNRAVSLKCTVVVLLDGPGDTHKRGRDTFRVGVGAGEKRRPHFSVKIRDAEHSFDNVPTSTRAHCHRN